MSVDQEIQVMVVGAGITGLSFAGLLQQAGVEPVVIEATEEFDKRDPAVELWPETMSLLDQLAVADEIRERGTLITEWERRQSDGTIVDCLETNPPAGMVVIPYERLREILINKVGASSIRMGTTIRSMEPTHRPTTVTFADGVREKFDLVVGADGVHSRTRELLGGPSPAACGTVTVTFPLPTSKDVSGMSEIWTVDGTVFRVLPVADRPIGVLTLPTETESEATPAVPSDLNSGIDWVLPQSLDMVDPNEVQSQMDVRSDSHLWTEGRVALIGAAAHAVHRLTGLGATLAIEDATVLVSELVNRDDALTTRLADYAARRESRIKDIFDRPETNFPPLLSSLGNGSLGLSRVLDIRGDQLTAAFGSGPPQPTVDPIPFYR